ncbi:MAG: hypothetical protein EXR79_09520 [Myxococcales bacterium]|nr:hypothetical protein [Myxococcales bacterium]
MLRPYPSLVTLLAALVVSAAVCAACGSAEQKGANSDASADATADSAGTDVGTAADGAGSGDSAAADIHTPGYADPSARGWAWSRTVVHIHSAWSHDACDGEIDKTGKANPECLQQLRQALCNSGLGVAFLTDHPSHMKQQKFEDLLLFQATAGDVLVAGPLGGPWANVVTCPATAELPSHDVVLTVGFEATHTMPVGLFGHFTQTEFEGETISDEVPLAKAQAAVDHAHAVGAVVCNAHSEEDDISAERLVASGIDAMEIYNTHANFKTIMGVSTKGAKSDLSRIFHLELFLGPKETSPHPDLSLMIMLDIQPEAAFTKWQRTLAFRHITGVIGNDVHQNVVLEPYCAKGQMLEGLCDALEEDYPKLASLLLKGGKLILADGKRLDDYTRLLRWISWHALLPKDTKPADRATAMKTALKAGRGWVVYDLLGRPDGVDFRGVAGAGVTEMGGTLPQGGRFVVSRPGRPQPWPWSPFAVADTQESALRTIMWHIAPGAAAAVKVLDVSGWGAPLEYVPAAAGRYHVEFRLVPRHLKGPLKAIAKYADVEQRWAVSNPIQVDP